MRVTWDKKGPASVARIDHRLPAYTSGQKELIARHLSAKQDTHGNIDAFLDLFVERLLLSRVIEFEGQEVNVRHGEIDIQVITTGEAYQVISFIERTLDKLINTAPAAGVAASILKSFGFDPDLQRKTKKKIYVIEGFKEGLDAIKIDPFSDVFELRNVEGKRLSLLRQFSERTSHIATQISTQKSWTMEVLRLAGLPIPVSSIVRSRSEALAFCARLRPTTSVIKPANTDWGIAVSTNLGTDDEVAKAYEIASKHGHVLAQEFIEGDDYRLLVVDGEMAGVTLRIPFNVIGNGRDNIRALARRKLIERSKDKFYKDFMKIDIEAAETNLALSRQGFALTDVPADGVRVRLRDNSNVSSGGEHKEVTGICHPDNIQLAIEAANVVGLDIAGIDLLSKDISVSWMNNGAKICEINPSPAVSVSIASNMLLKRIDVSGNEGESRSDIGDMLCIGRTGSGRVDRRLSAYQNLDELSIDQYFHQTYLTRRHANFRLQVSFDRFMSWGCPNRNIRLALVNAENASDEGIIREIMRRIPSNCRLEIISD
jgi:D-alanine-D-alanine ligase-like ATP-grasp enzyme